MRIEREPATFLNLLKTCKNKRFAVDLNRFKKHLNKYRIFT